MLFISQLILSHADADLTSSKSLYRDGIIEIRPSDTDNNSDKFTIDINGSASISRTRTSTTDVRDICLPRPNSRPYACKLCKMTFGKLGRLKSHEVIHNAECVPLKCAHCNKKFLVEGKLRRHEKQVHTDDRPFECEICHKTFKYSYEVKAHMSIHSGNGSRHTCSLCGKWFTFMSDLKQHLVNHGLLQKTFSCSMCNQLFSSFSSLQQHMQIHANTSPDAHINVAVSNEGFSSSPNLRKRMEIHPSPLTDTDDNKQTRAVYYGSNETSSSYADFKQLVEETHTGFPPPPPHVNYIRKCNVCKRRFRNFFYLQKHMEGHAKERPFPCKLCGRRFAQKSNLKEHTMLHTNDQPFGCEICGKLFTRPDKLERHSLIHVFEPTCTSDVSAALEPSPTLNDLTDKAANKLHVCDICSRKFEDKHMFETHVRLHSRLQTLYQRQQSK